MPLLRNRSADWTERTLFTHVGRWPKGADPDQFKYMKCSVRTPRWHLVCDTKDGAKQWQLFDVSADYGEKADAAAAHPDVVARLDAEYDRWWAAVRPLMVNEAASATPKEIAFHVLYRKQFGEPGK